MAENLPRSDRLGSVKKDLSTIFAVADSIPLFNSCKAAKGNKIGRRLNLIF